MNLLFYFILSVFVVSEILIYRQTHTKTARHPVTIMRNLFKVHYDIILNEDQVNLLFSIIVSVFVVGGMIGALSGMSFICQGGRGHWTINYTGTQFLK